MYKQTGFYLMVLIVIFLYLANSFSATSTNGLKLDQKRSFALLFGRYGLGSDTILPHRPVNGNENDNMAIPRRNDMKKKWARFFQGSQSPYSIAFPALIRSR
ncbi:hypothetical protein I4U23_031165 [Adineta vaga]|nr:hypothetical protein I4U23_031165 [Adineta vaga]